MKSIALFNVYPTWRGPVSDKRIPLGMLYLADSLKKAGYGVNCLHIEEGQIESVTLEDCLFVGICSIMTGFSLRAAISLSKHLKGLHPDIPIVWGGSMPTVIPEVCLREDYVDAVGMGDGEKLIVDVARMYEGEVDRNQIKGLSFRDSSGVVRVNGIPRIIMDLDRFHPDYSAINLQEYIFDGRISGLIMSSRGCPCSCSFCYKSSVSGRHWRSHSAGYVIDLIRVLHEKFRFDVFSFSDDNFFVNRERGMKILEEVERLGLHIFSLDVNIKTLSPADIEYIEKCGVESIFFGTETLNPRLMKYVGKNQTKEEVISFLQDFSRYAPNVQVQTEILMAFPFESMRELRQEIKDGLELYRFHKHLSAYFGTLFPLPGTKMMEWANDNGFKPRRLEDYSEIDLNMAWYICSKWFTIKESDKNKLRLTESYSPLICLDLRRFNLKSWLLFRLAKFRLRNWFFLFHKMDFFLQCHTMKGLIYYVLHGILGERLWQEINKLRKGKVVK